MQSLRWKLGLILPALLAFAFFNLPAFSAAQHAAAKTAAGKKSGKEAAKSKAVPKTSGKSTSKTATKAPAKGASKGHATRAAGPAKSQAKGSARAGARGTRQGSSRTASKGAAKRAPQKTVYRQQQPEPERIREIQQALNDRGYPLAVSGAWDPSTVDALRKFQTDQKIDNLSGKGKLDSMTLIALGLGPKREPSPDPVEVPRQTPEGKLP